MIPSAEQVFIRKCDQLEVALREPTRLSVIDAAARVWELLLDEHPLVHQVNRSLRVPLRFRVNRLPNWNELSTIGRANVAYPGLALAPGRGAWIRGELDLKLDIFLSQPVVQSSHHVVTVRELIAFAANKAGGRHFDAGEDKTRRVLDALVRALDTDEMPVFPNLLHAAAAVVLEAVKPLRERIIASQVEAA